MSRTGYWNDPIITFVLGKVTVWNERSAASNFFDAHRASFGDFADKLSDLERRFFSDRNMNDAPQDLKKWVFCSAAYDYCCYMGCGVDEMAINTQWDIMKKISPDRYEEMLPVLLFDR